MSNSHPTTVAYDAMWHCATDEIEVKRIAQSRSCRKHLPLGYVCGLLEVGLVAMTARGSERQI